MYGLFKQANMGDNTASSPWLPGEAKMKWAAWEACKGKTKEEAMTEYIAELERQKVRACPPASLPARPRPALPRARAPHPAPPSPPAVGTVLAPLVVRALWLCSRGVLQAEYA